jgi:DNA-binding HxlR family transcriptional regulator
VEYRLSKVGHTLVPVVTGMHDWGVAHLVRDDGLKKVRLATKRRSASAR